MMKTTIACKNLSKPSNGLGVCDSLSLSPMTSQFFALTINSLSFSPFIYFFLLSYAFNYSGSKLNSS